MQCVEHDKVLGKHTYARVWSKELQRVTTLHRIVYCQHAGVSLSSISGQVVRHTCDNRRCINPEHLILGSYKDNTADMWTRGRQCVLRGVDNHTAKLSSADVDYIRKHYIKGHKEYGARALGRRFGLAHCNILNVINGRAYVG